MIGKLKVKNEKLKVWKAGAVFILAGFFFGFVPKALAISPYDPLFVTDPTALTKQWYLEKIQVPEAWQETTGGSVVVAVVDTGIDGKHEDLSDGRVGKGFASYCAVKNAANPDICDQKIVREITPGENSDDNGHGTIVAGIIGAIPNNNKGIAGINWNIRLMPIKVLDAQGDGFATDMAQGLKWAVDNGAKIINLSIGGEGLLGSDVVQDAVNYAFDKGVLLVAAAGNDAAENGLNLNISPALPVCADGEKNAVLGVAAVDFTDKKAGFSNYGSNCIDLAAPGTGTFIDRQQKQGLISTYFDPATPNEQGLYAYVVGTSVAAPMVSGVAALVLSVNPNMDGRFLRDRLMVSVDNIDEFNNTGCGSGSCVGQIGRGRINALKAVNTKNKFPSGSLVMDSGGQIYLIEAGSKRIMSGFVINQRFPSIPTVEAAPGDLETYLTGVPIPPADGSLIKSPGLTTVYLMENEKLHGLSYLAFISRNFRFADVVTLPAEEIAGYLRGDDLGVANGVLIKAAENPAVFIVNNGRRKLLSFFSFIEWGFAGRQIGITAQNELELYPQDPGLYSPPEGTLMLGDESTTVYEVKSGKLRGLNLAAFMNRGYIFSQIKILPQQEMKFYEYGEDIVE